jgi:uncharacterized protein YbjT (DUF2867 family)
MNNISRVLLVTGATGKHGGSVVDALLKSPAFSPSTTTIIGVTRNPDSPSARALAAKSDIPALFRTASQVTSRPVWGVFSVQIPMGKGQNAQTEELYGKGPVDEALKQGVRQFVYTSVERGGDEASWTNPTAVPHFTSKHRVEQHLRDRASTQRQKDMLMGWTILRPVAFMENLTPDFFGKVFATIMRDALRGKALQMVSTSDDGYFAAEALLKPDEYKYRAIGLAGDEVTYTQFKAVFEEVTGAPPPVTFGFIGAGVLWGVKEMGEMFKFFRTEGNKSNIKALREMNPALLDLRTWLKEKSKFQIRH